MSSVMKAILAHQPVPRLRTPVRSSLGSSEITALAGLLPVGSQVLALDWVWTEGSSFEGGSSATSRSPLQREAPLMLAELVHYLCLHVVEHTPEALRAPVIPADA
jgi:hypothetical protein